MDRHEAERILERYRAGTCTAKERRLVEAWFNRELSENQLDVEPDWEVAKATIWRRLNSTTNRPRRIRRWFPYVAAAFIAAAAATWMFLDHPIFNRSSQFVNLESEDIPPGGNRATLTLADGRRIALDEARDGIVMGSGEIMYSDGNPLAEVGGSEGEQVDIPLLELSTPKGGAYQITLPDGTRVWLNAASTLKYPARFDGDERVVELEGEAYFEVVQIRKDVNSRRQPMEVSQHVPFKVVTNSQTIAVLGTEFNISAYADDPETKTTLVEGKVRVAAIVPGASNLTPPVSYLEPGQQAVTRGSLLEVSEVDVFDYTAWRDGIIVLNGARLADVMRQVERWYDVTIDVPALKTNKTAYVIINRNENLSSVLKALEETYQVKLKLEGRRVGVIE